MRNGIKRLLSMTLALVMIISMVPGFATQAHAAGALSGLTVSGLGVSYTDASDSKGAAVWSASGTSITGKATGYKKFFSLSITTKLTLTNNLTSEATLKFSYTLTGGGSVSGISDGSYEGKLAAGDSITITLTSPSGDNTNLLSITGLSLIPVGAGDVTTTFELAAAGGSYTVGGTAVTAKTEKKAAAGTSYALVASPASGYVFFGWYNGSAYISYDASMTLTPAENQTITPIFVPSTTALFGVGSAKFVDLGEADTYASTNTVRTIVLLNNGTISGSYTISAGNTLLIPYDDANTVHTEASNIDQKGFLQEPNDWTKPSA